MHLDLRLTVPRQQSGQQFDVVGVLRVERGEGVEVSCSERSVPLGIDTSRLAPKRIAVTGLGGRGGKGRLLCLGNKRKEPASHRHHGGDQQGPYWGVSRWSKPG